MNVFVLCIYIDPTLIQQDITQDQSCMGQNRERLQLHDLGSVKKNCIRFYDDVNSASRMVLHARLQSYPGQIVVLTLEILEILEIWDGDLAVKC